MEKEISEKPEVSRKEINSLIRFLGDFPKGLEVDKEIFNQREEYWNKVSGILRKEVEEGRLDWGQYDTLQGSLVAVKEWLSDHDTLTGLHNKKSYEETIKKEVNRAEHYNRPLSLLVIDVDGLKAWNDEGKSHHLGDLAIKNTASSITKSIRLGDFAARWGGDEFAVILPNANAEAAKEVSQRILEEVRKKAPVSKKKLSVSIGVKQYRGEGPQNFFNKADDAAYKAKTSSEKIVVVKD